MARSKGQGSIYLCKDGIYQGRIKKNGITRYVYNKDKKIVESELHRLSLLSMSDFEHKEVNIKFQNYVYNYLYTFKYGHIKDSSFDRIDSIYRKHIVDSSIGVITLNELNDINVQMYINSKCSEDISYSTIKKVFELIRSILNYAYKKNDINIDIGGIIHLPSSDHFKPIKTIDIYTQEECNKLCDYILNANSKKDIRFLRYSPVKIIMLNTGLRAGELLALKWSDVDFNNRIIHINKTLSLVCDRNNPDSNNKHHKNVISKPKTVNSIRDIPLNNNCIVAFNKLMDNYELFNCVCEFVCCNLNDEFIRLRSMEIKLEKICNKINIEYKGIHALRHTFASNLIKCGVSPKVVSDLLGHANVVFTMNRYVHVNDDDLTSAVNLL